MLRARLAHLPLGRLAVASCTFVLGLLTAGYAATGRFPLDGSGGAARASVSSVTGPLVANELEGSAVLEANRLGPGDGRVGEVTIANAGDAGGLFVLSAQDLVDVPAPAGLLSEMLDLIVLEVTPGRAPSPVFAGKLAELGSIMLGHLEAGESRRYRFVVTFTALGGNAWQGARSRVTFVWEAVEDGSVPPPTTTTTTTPTTPTTTATTAAPPAGGSSTTPAPPTTATAPSLSGIGSAPPVIRLDAKARQLARNRRVLAWVTCATACRTTVSAMVRIPGRRKALRLKAAKLRPRAGVRTKVRLRLPARAVRAAMAARTKRHAVTVSLRATATIGGKTVVVKRTVKLRR